MRAVMWIAVVGCVAPALPQAGAAEPTPVEVFEKRIIPIFKSPNPSSCVQCHLAGVDLKDYILPDAEKTFRSLRDQGLINLAAPEKSKIVALIDMGGGAAKGPNAVTAKVTFDGAKPGQEATVRFELTDPSGQPLADLEPYMGATGHLVVVSADATRYVHAHPSEGQTGAKNVVAFGATFPQAGLYKGWGQFKRGGQVRIVPFVVDVP